MHRHQAKRGCYIPFSKIAAKRVSFPFRYQIAYFFSVFFFYFFLVLFQLRKLVIFHNRFSLVVESSAHQVLMS